MALWYAIAWSIVSGIYKSQGTGLGLYILKMIVEKSMSGEVKIFNSKDGAICKIKIFDFSA